MLETSNLRELVVKSCGWQLVENFNEHLISDDSAEKRPQESHTLEVRDHGFFWNHQVSATVAFGFTEKTVLSTISKWAANVRKAGSLSHQVVPIGS